MNFSTDYAAKGLDQEGMFTLQNASRKSVGRIAGPNRHLGLCDNLSLVISLINPMYGNPRYRVAGSNHRFMHMYAIHAFSAIPRQKCRVYVEYAIVITLQHLDRQHAHITQQQDNIGLFFGEKGQQLLRQGGFTALGFQTDMIGGDSCPAGPFKGKSARIVTDDRFYIGIDATFGHGIDDSLQVRPPMRCENDNIHTHRMCVCNRYSIVCASFRERGTSIRR